MRQNANKKRSMQAMNRAIRAVKLFAVSEATCWKALVALQATISVWLIQESQHDPSLTLLSVVIWGGAAICAEDKLEGLRLKPSRLSFAVGMLLVLAATLRSTLVLDKERIVLILPLLQGLGLALMVRPIRRLSSLRQPLFALSLLPIQDVMLRLLPNDWISVATAKLSWLYLMICGFETETSGRYLQAGQRGVEILTECNGVDLIAQLTTIAIIFAMAFPVRNILLRVSFVSLAPILAFAINSARVSVLAAVVGSSLSFRDAIFRFLHDRDQWGGLIFAGIASAILGQLYMILIERELRGKQS
jgi:exosortase/archaeosortase family protein